MAKPAESAMHVSKVLHQYFRETQPYSLLRSRAIRAGLLPRPAPVDFNLKREAEESANEDDAREYQQTLDGGFDRDSVDDVGCYQEFELKKDGMDLPRLNRKPDTRTDREEVCRAMPTRKIVNGPKAPITMMAVPTISTALVAKWIQ